MQIVPPYFEDTVADDDAAAILAVFRSSLEGRIHMKCESEGILPLKETEAPMLHKQLFGGHAALAR